MSWLLDEIGFKKLTSEEDDYLSDLAADTVLNRVIIKVADRFDQESFSKIHALFRDENQEPLQAFMKEHQLDLDEFIDEEVDNYRQEITRAKQTLTEETNG
jgi:hypothetical protein